MASTTEPRHVDIGGRRLWTQTRGSGPSVILENGGGAPGVGGWPFIEPKVADFATVTTYDRASMGQSDRVDEPPSAEEFVGDLHALLGRVEVDGPHVIVGWSLTGLSTLLYASAHPEDVAGIVLLDPTPYDLYDDLSPLWKLATNPVLAGGMTARLGAKGYFQKPKGRAKLEKLAGKTMGPNMPAEGRELVLDLMADPWQGFPATLHESRRVVESCQQVKERVIEPRALPDVPLTVITSGHRGDKGPALKFGEKIRNSHVRLAAMVPRGRHVDAPEAGHLIGLEAPDLVVEEIRNVLAQVGAA